MHITAMFITESSLQNVLLPLWCQSFRSEFNEVCLWYLLHTDHLVLPTLYKSDFQQFYTAFFSFVWHIYTHSSVALHSFVYSIKLVRHAIFFLSLFISLLQHLDYLTSTQPWIFFFFAVFILTLLPCILLPSLHMILEESDMFTKQQCLILSRSVSLWNLMKTYRKNKNKDRGDPLLP